MSRGYGRGGRESKVYPPRMSGPGIFVSHYPIIMKDLRRVFALLFSKEKIEHFHPAFGKRHVKVLSVQHVVSSFVLDEVFFAVVWSWPSYQITSGEGRQRIHIGA